MKFFKSKFMRIMRLTIVIITIALMQVSAAGLAQKVSLSFKNVPLEQVLVAVKQQTAYNFVYTEDVIAKAKRVTIHLKDADLKDALLACFQNQPLNFTIEQNTIVVKEKEPSFLDNLLDRFAAVDVRGRVLDEAGNPLVGATIQVKGKALAYKTNDKGEFEIKGVDEDAVLLVSYVGFKTLEIALKDAVMPLEIKLNVATGELEEVKVVYNTGYQELNKERSTGSFVQIDNELFNRAVGTNVLDRIYNVVSGLIHAPGGDNPGKTGIVIRGLSTINAGTDPLIVVDNFPYEGDLNNLNPNDIESVTVLKDAAASSIWGVRAGNGVIVITTKKGGFNQDTRVGFNSNVTIGQKPDLFYIPFISSKDIIDVEKMQFATGKYNEYDDLYPSFNYFPVLPQSIEILLNARKINKGTSGYNALNDPSVIAKLDELSAHDVRNDIDKYLLQNSLNQQYALNLSGGGSNFNYYASLGYDKNKGNNLKDDNNRLSLNFTNTWRPIKNLEISTGLVHTRINSENAGLNYSGLLPQQSISPYTMLIDAYGNPLNIPSRYRTAYVDTASNPGLLDWHYSPIVDHKFVDNENRQYDTRISAVLNYKVQPWLKAEFQYQNQTSLSNTRNHGMQESFFVRDQVNKFITKDVSGKIVYPFPLGDVLDLSNSSFKAWNIRGSLKFDHQFGNHQINAFLGMELRETNTETNFNSLYGYDPETYTSIPISFTQNFPVRPSGSQALTAMRNPSGYLTRNGSFYGNAVYNYKRKYIATISGRIDQSNFFGVKVNLRRVPLWHAGLAWNIHLENFYHLDWLSDLKLKASYGYTGNTNPGASSYPTFAYRTGTSSVPATNNLFGILLTPNNPQLRWERVKIINAGIEFGLKNNRINGSVEFYSKTGLDLLGPINTDPTTGVVLFTANQAGIKAKGIDFMLITKNIAKGAFEWRTDMFISFNKDRVTSYYNQFGNVGSNFTSGIAVEKGDPLYSLYSYRWAGLDPKTGDPRIYLADTISSFLNVSKATKEDLVLSGQRHPKIFGSFRNAFSYKEISISANITYQLGHYFRRSSVNYFDLIGSGWIGHADYALRWQKTGDDLHTSIPSRPVAAADGNRDAAYLYSTALVEKADQIRLQDIRLDYRIDKRLFRNLPFKQVSLYVYAANLGIIWRANKEGVDPDASSFRDIPIPKTVAFGLSANF